MKTMIAIPCMDTMDSLFVDSLLNLEHVGQVQHALHPGSLVYASRNDLAQAAVKQEADFVFWLDSDMIFPPQTLKDLMATLEKENADMVCGLYHARRPPYNPALYKRLRLGLRPGENEAEDYNDHPMDAPFEVEGCGFAGVLMRGKVLSEVIAKYHDAFGPLPGMGEDVSFCVRARGCGFRILCDPRVELGHHAQTVVTSRTFDAYRKSTEMKQHAE